MFAVVTSGRDVQAQCFSSPIPVVVAELLNPPPGPFPAVNCSHPIQPSPCVVIDFASFGTDWDGSNSQSYYDYCSAAPCRCWPEIQRAASGRTTRPAWLRVEVDDADADPKYPVITAYVAWDDDAHPCTGGIETCPYRCSVSFADDTERGRKFAEVEGTSGVDAHQRTYRLVKFRNGSE